MRFLLALLLLPNNAFADEATAVVLGVGGYQGEAVRRAIVVELDRVVALVPLEDAMNTADTIEADVNTPEGLMKVAESMGLELFVRGRVEGKRSKATVEILVIGPDGQTIATAKGKSPASKKNRLKLAEKTAELVQTALNQLEAELEAETEPVEGEEVLDEPLKDDDQKAGKKEVVAAPKIDDPEPVQATLQTEPEPKPLQVDLQTEPAPVEQVHLLSARAGVAVRARKAEVKLSDGRVARHDTGPFPEIALRVEGRPYAGLYAMLDFGIEVGLSSIEGTEEIETDALRVSGTVGWLFDLGVIDVGGGLGFGVDRFALSQNRTIDSTLYSYVRVAAIAQLMLFEAMMIELDAGLRPVLTTGELGDRWDQSANALGFEASLGVAHETDVGFTYGLTGQFSGYTVRFAKTDHLSATGGFDSSFSVAVTLGWVINPSR